jgi:GR25 family glycosyltransferase involved in LPS biosynthesis
MSADRSLLAARVLTMPGATARQKGMGDVLGRARGLRGVGWSFFEAVSHEAAGLAYDEAEARAAKGRTLSPAELSCFASHIALQREWLASDGSDVLLVVEDDVVLDPWFDFEGAARMARDAGLDYLRLYARTAMPHRPLAYVARTQVVRFTWSPGGTQAFMVTRAGARRVVDAVAAQSGIVRPIDDLIDRTWEVGNAVYALFPSPALELNMPTTIHGPDQVRLRHGRQAALDAAPPGLAARAAARARALRERVARRLDKARLRRADDEVAARVRAFMEAPGFNHFQAADG